MAEQTSVEENCTIIGVLNKDWKKGAQIGNGAFGKVYLVKSLRDNSEPKYVVKEIQYEKDKTDSKLLQSFYNETKVFKELGAHDRIVPFIGTGKSDACLSIFMGYMKQGNLNSYSKNKQGLGEEETRHFARQILEGLEFLHGNKIIHRDVKGANVLLEDDRHVRLTDFGLSKILENTNSTASNEIGTMRWMAPEVVNLEGNVRTYNTKADIWSVGCTIIEMMTGDIPYPDVENCQVVMKIKERQIPTLNKSAKTSRDLKDFLEKTFQHCAENRPSAKDLLDNDNFLGRTIPQYRTEDINGISRENGQEFGCKKTEGLKIVLLGITGQGKSATGNSIIGRNMFEESATANSTTHLITRMFAKKEFQTHTIFDTRGFCDVDESNPTLSIVKQMDTLMEACQEVDAFLLVVREGAFKSSEMFTVVENLKTIFGKHFIKNHCYLVMTHTENIVNEEDYKNSLETATGKVKELYLELEKRLFFIKNKIDYKDRVLKGDELLEKLQLWRQNEVPYRADEHFKREEQARQQLAFDSEKDKIRKALSEEIESLRTTIENELIINGYVSDLLKNELSLLYEKIRRKKNSDSHFLNDLLDQVRKIDESIQNKRTGFCVIH